MLHKTQDSRPVYAIIAFYLIMHTAIVILATLIVARGGLSTALTIAAVVGTTALTAYTIFRTAKCVNEIIKHRATVMSQVITMMQSESMNLEQQAKELEQRATMLNEQQRTITINAGLMSQYGHEMDELVASIDSQYGDSAKEPRDH